MTGAEERAGASSLGWQLRSSRYLHQSRWYDIRQDSIGLPGGIERTYTYIEHPGSVFVVPVLSDGRVVLIRSFRYTLDDWCWEIPAGGLGDKPGVEPADVAREELAEEVGATCRELVELGRFALGNGMARHYATYFLGRDTVLGGETQLEDLEVIDRVEAFSFDDVVAMISRGEIGDGDSVLGLLLAQGALRGAS